MLANLSDEGAQVGLVWFSSHSPLPSLVRLLSIFGFWFFRMYIHDTRSLVDKYLLAGCELRSYEWSLSHLFTHTLWSHCKGQSRLWSCCLKLCKTSNQLIRYLGCRGQISPTDRCEASSYPFSSSPWGEGRLRLRRSRMIEIARCKWILFASPRHRQAFSLPIYLKKTTMIEYDFILRVP